MKKQGDLCTAAVRSDHILYSEKSAPEAAVHLQVNFFVQNINVTAWEGRTAKRSLPYRRCHVGEAQLADQEEGEGEAHVKLNGLGFGVGYGFSVEMVSEEGRLEEESIILV